MSQAPGLGTSIVIFALIPAICEEFAFRGFILSGLEHQHRTRSAILLSALMFGFLHVLLSLFQQLFNATLLGIVLGLLAVRSRSILPGIVFHFINNALAVALGSVVHASWAAGIVPWIYRNPDDGLYHRHGSWSSVLSFSGGLAVLFVEVEIEMPPMRRGTLTIEARYVYPVEGPPIENGCLTIEHGRIAWVGSSSDRACDMNLGNVAIVPGFVNAHTHLELASLGPAGVRRRKRGLLAAACGRPEAGRSRRNDTGDRESQRQGVDRRGDDASGRYHDGGPLVGFGRGRASAGRGLRRVDRVEA